jgi:hypothetical protein
MKSKKLIAISMIMMMMLGCSISFFATSTPTVGIEPTGTVTLSATDLLLTPSETSAVTVPPTNPPGLTVDGIKNSLIFAPEIQRIVQLTNGEYTESLSDGSVLLVVLNENIAFGDLNKDGVEDAAFLIIESMGGTGRFYSISSLLSGPQGFTQSNSIFIDDRAIIHTLGIADGQIILNVNVHDINDPMVNPTLNVTKTFQLFNEKLDIWRQTILMSNGTDRSINIESPQEETEFNGDVTITGSMPIAPFENNLQIQIIGPIGTEMFVGPFMVTADDMGQPATFNQTITLPAYPAGSLVKIQLTEYSMADGSPRIIDSVLIIVK